MKLTQPFRLGRDVRTVPLPAAGVSYPAGAPTTIVGFGQQHQAVDTPSGALVGVRASILPQGVCGVPRWFLLPLNGVRLCAAAPAGAACYGDSGSPLVTGGPRPVLVGVLSEFRGRGCSRGTAQIYTYVAAAEIRRFIAGDRHPPVAPRLTTASIRLHYSDPIRVGDVVSCHAAWLAPSTRVRYTFATFDGRVLQAGPERAYVVAPAAAGHELLCTLVATNAGGTTIAAQFLTTVATSQRS
jgi:hypothetical protein